MICTSISGVRSQG